MISGTQIDIIYLFFIAVHNQYYNNITVEFYGYESNFIFTNNFIKYRINYKKINYNNNRW